jgi:hypothetical protein
MQNISEPELCHSKRGREDGKGKGGARYCMRYHFVVFSFLPVPQLAGYQRILTVNEVWRYLVTSINDKWQPNLNGFGLTYTKKEMS